MMMLNGCALMHKGHTRLGWGGGCETGGRILTAMAPIDLAPGEKTFIRFCYSMGGAMSLWFFDGDGAICNVWWWAGDPYDVTLSLALQKKGCKVVRDLPPCLPTILLHKHKQRQDNPHPPRPRFHY